MAKQLKDNAAIDEIKALEDRRYRAMLAADTAVLNELCSDDLIYTHSKANAAAGVFVALEIVRVIWVLWHGR